MERGKVYLLDYQEVRRPCDERLVDKVLEVLLFALFGSSIKIGLKCKCQDKQQCAKVHVTTV